MQVYNVTNLPVYLPFDKSPTPFGDVFDDGSATNASPAVFTAVGYAAVAGDAVALSVDAGGSLDANFTVGTKYFVVNPSGNTFQLSATKGGAAINAAAAASTGLSVHLVSGEVDGTFIPFKTGATVVVLNLSAGTLVLQGAPDTSAPVPGGVPGYPPPKGPGTYTTIVSVAAGSAALAQLSNDWIRVSTSGTLVLLQN